MKKLILIMAIGLMACEKDPVPSYRPGDRVVAAEIILTPHARRDSILPGETGTVLLITGFDPVVYKIAWNECLPVWNLKGSRYKLPVKSEAGEGQLRKGH